VTDTNEAIAIEVVLQHEPKIEVDYGDTVIACQAKDCGFTATGGGWADHVADAINDHLGLWGPVDEEEEDPFENGPYGDEW
jgi:hypothetical protein